MKSVQQYMHRKALNQQLSVHPLSLNAAKPGKSMHIYENYTLNLTTEPHDVYSRSKQQPKEADAPNSSAEINVEHLEDILKSEISNQDVAKGLEFFILRQMKMRNITSPAQIQSFLTDEIIDNILNEQAHILLNKFNAHVSDMSRILAENMASVNKLYDSKIELLSTAFEADFARLSSLFSGLNKRLENLKAVSGVLTKDSFTLFLKKYKESDEVPSIIEEKMLIMARCVQDRLVALRSSFEEGYSKLKHSITIANASIKMHLDLSCPKCGEPYNTARRVLMLAPCGHSICEACLYDISGQMCAAKALTMASKRTVCPRCNSLISQVAVDRMINSRIAGRELDPRSVYARIESNMGYIQQALLKVDVLNPDALLHEHDDNGASRHEAHNHNTSDKEYR